MKGKKIYLFQYSKISLLALGLLKINLTIHAGVVATLSPVGATNNFPSKPVHTGVGSLGFDSSNPSGAEGLTIQGGVAHGVPAGRAIGEIFQWPGVPGTLNSIDFVITGSGGEGIYQAFLFDLGTRTYFTGGSVFAPRNHSNLFNASDTFALTNTTTKSFVELDFSGTNTVTLQTGHSYAFGVLSVTNVSDLFMERSGGAASDAYGLGFIADSLNATSVNASPFGNSVRNVFVGIYATPIAEPTISMAMIWRR